MTKRGKVLRDPHAGPGLVMAEGRQYPFVDGVWKSDAPPEPGLLVDLDVDEDGQVRAIYVVPEWQLAQEQAGAVVSRAGRASGVSFISPFGIAVLVGTAILAVAWWFLPAFTVQSPLLGRLEFTFWQGLAFLDSQPVLEWLDRRGNPEAGIYGIAAIMALAGPFLPFFWKDRRAILAGVLPLLFTAIAGIAMYSAMVRTTGTGMRPTPGLGIYLAALASLCLALLAVRQFVVSKPVEAPKSPHMRRAA